MGGGRIVAGGKDVPLDPEAKRDMIRKNLGLGHSPEVREEAILKIQARQRGIKARAELDGHRAAAETRRVNCAATRIQSLHRGNMGRAHIARLSVGGKAVAFLEVPTGEEAGAKEEEQEGVPTEEEVLAMEAMAEELKAAGSEEEAAEAAAMAAGMREARLLADALAAEQAVDAVSKAMAAADEAEERQALVQPPGSTAVAGGTEDGEEGEEPEDTEEAMLAMEAMAEELKAAGSEEEAAEAAAMAAGMREVLAAQSAGSGPSAPTTTIEQETKAATKIQSVARGHAARVEANDIKTPTTKELSELENAITEAQALAASLREEGRPEEAAEADAMVEQLKLAKGGHLPVE